MTPTQQKVYDTLLRYFGTHCTLNPSIPAEVGCAEAASFVLQKAGVKGLPTTGISGTATLYEWLKSNPHFLRVYAPEAGAIIISPTGYGNGSVTGHVGFLGYKGHVFPGDFGIVSNDSQTGLLLELWNLTNWRKNYGVVGGLPIAFFRPL